MKWFRMWTDITDDIKMLQLSDYEFRMWTYLLAYASKTDSLSGEFHITFKLLSLHFHQRFNLFSRAIETFQKLGLITVDEGGYITITNWNKRQFRSDNSYDRVKKHRQVNSKRNVSETPPDTDTDTDTDNTPIVPLKTGTIYTDDFSAFWKVYPKKVGKDAAWRRWKSLNGTRPEIADLVSAIVKQAQSAQWQNENGRFIPNPATWLHEGRWKDEELIQEGGCDAWLKQVSQRQ